MATQTTGLASSIRTSTESDTFDLAGMAQSTITSNVTSAFTDPFPLDHMIRITLITGAGKLGRQKYDDKCGQFVTNTLRTMDFSEDRAGSCIPECAGTFKMQHDTGKNLKTVVIFPKIRGGGEDGGVDGMASLSLSDSLIPSGSPNHMCAVSSVNVFERILDSKCPSWAQKKECFALLENFMVILKDLDEKLMTGKPLEEDEQELYDTMAIELLSKKELIIKKKMQEQVDTGNITHFEKQILLEQVQSKLDANSEEISESQKKPKKLEKLKTVQGKLESRQTKLENIKPQPPHRLKHEPDIAKLRLEMKPLKKLEDSAKGRLLSIKESAAMTRLDELHHEIMNFEDASRGWFEVEEAFNARVEASRATAAAKEKLYANKKKSSGGSSAAKSSFKAVGKTGWVTPGSTGGKKKGPAAKKTGGGSVFAAMMMDSDSD